MRGILGPIMPSYNMPVMWGRYLAMLTIPPMICLLCGGIHQWQSCPPIICLLCGISINGNNPSYNMPVMRGRYLSMPTNPPIICLLCGGIHQWKSMEIKPSYNMAVMWGRYLLMLTNPPIICLLCGGIHQWQSFPPIIHLLWGGDIYQWQ